MGALLQRISEMLRARKRRKVSQFWERYRADVRHAIAAVKAAGFIGPSWHAHDLRPGGEYSAQIWAEEQEKAKCRVFFTGFSIHKR